MSERKWTPGPWSIVDRVVEEDGSVSARHIVGGGDFFVCPLEAQTIAELAVKAPGSIFDTSPRKEADARLIAASPVMYEALVDVRRALELANCTGELAVVDAALATANRGERNDD